jgi:uncharacterized protein
MTPDAFHVMVKPIGAVCNLNCAYCYFLSKEEMYPGSDFRMTEDTLEEFSKQYVQVHSVPEVTFGWQGGEPALMGLAFFQKALTYQAQYRKSRMRIINSLKTNGTLLDDSLCQFFKQNNFLIGLNLDGPEQLHNAYRKDKSGNPSFSKVMNGVNLLKKHQVEFNILKTVHAAKRSQNMDYVAG